MDLVMPNMSGIDAARRIRALGGPAGRVGIVALTATTASEDRARCAQAGIEAVIGKPAPAGELLALVDLHAATIAGAARSDAPAAAAAAVSGRPFRDASPRASLPPVLDAERFAELAHSVPPSHLDGLAALCASELRALSHRLCEALLHDEREEIGRRAHGLAGLCGVYGLTALMLRMRRMLADVMADDLAAARFEGLGVPADVELAIAALRAAASPGAASPSLPRAA